MSIFSLVVYVPEASVEDVKSAIFAAGVGRLGTYDCCCFCTRGTGQFRPLPGSNPTIGSTMAVEHVSEVRLECIVPQERMPDVVAAIRASHPYEVPAFHYYQVNIECALS